MVLGTPGRDLGAGSGQVLGVFIAEPHSEPCLLVTYGNRGITAVKPVRA
jgi:hypothetical protein